MHLLKKCMSLSVTVLLTSLALFPHSAPAQQVATNRASLRVQFTNLRNTKGVLRVLLFDNSKDGKGFPGDPATARESRVVDLAKEMKVGSTKTTITFSELPPGTYAIAALHDENNNGKMDCYWYGKPKEGSAASNNPRPKTRAPRWNEAKFELSASSKSIDISLWYP